MAEPVFQKFLRRLSVPLIHGEKEKPDGQTEKKAGIQTSPDSDMQTTDRNVRSNSAPALENGLVNLNTADVAALMTLPGIGESRAKAIISYREQHGAFAQIEDIMKISGIKQAAFSKIKDKITV